MLPEFLLLDHPEAQVRFAAAKRLLTLSEQQPEMAAKDALFYRKLLSHKNNIFKWTGIAALGNMAAFLSEKDAETLIRELCKWLHAGQLITANHCIASLSKIAVAHPQFLQKIHKNLMQVSQDIFESEECRAIAMGKVVLELHHFENTLTTSKKTQAFIQECLNSQRPATRKKAEVWLKKHTKKS